MRRDLSPWDTPGARRPGGRFTLDPALEAAHHQQLTFEDLGTPLSEVTFVVVDLETTGTRARGAAITEIGAVKVRGGEELGTFQTLVKPDHPIPPMIQSLTGITNQMVRTAPDLAPSFASFLEFAGFERGSVLVAHNASFDVSFLKAAARSLSYRWPNPTVVDTLRLARRVLTRDEVRNHKLATLAALFGASVTPSHRALDDARATVDVLHALLERVGPLGITHAEDLATLTDPVPPRRRRKAHLADGLPSRPGVYRFLGPAEEVLYVGTATNLRRRVRSYFTTAEKRTRIGEMIDLANRVDAVECAGALEARVRELRMIAAHDPPYNVRSRRPGRTRYVVLTREPYPRPIVTATVNVAERAVWGPYPSTAMARRAATALIEATGLRSCTRRLPGVPRSGARACMARDLGTCAAPCVDEATRAAYARALDAARAALSGDICALHAACLSRIGTLAAAERFEEAADARDRLRAALYGARRFEELLPYLLAPEIVAARPCADGAWELAIIRYGRLAGSLRLPAGASADPYLRGALQLAESVEPPSTFGERASVEETGAIVRWLEAADTRIGHVRAPHVPLACRRHSPLDTVWDLPDGTHSET
ncbi:MAG: DEDD exonuclease domain-containing protein [Bowdeniella nasicola]|nr:DEDD exonuclease domain-containing protein [Bowdeniella nasicola]